MKATDIIRNLLDLIDQVDCGQKADQPESSPEEIQTGVDTNRFKQIYAILDAENNSAAIYNNSPNTVVTRIDSVTTDAGGGWNGPKNPADIKADSISMYPNYLHKPGE